MAQWLERVPATWWMWAGLLSRIIAALVGGYVVAALSAVATLALPVDKVQAVLTGSQLSFLVYTAAVIWVFAVRNAWRAWAGLVIASLVLLPAAAWVWQS